MDNWQPDYLSQPHLDSTEGPLHPGITEPVSQLRDAKCESPGPKVKQQTRRICFEVQGSSGGNGGCSGGSVGLVQHVCFSSPKTSSFSAQDWGHFSEPHSFGLAQTVLQPDQNLGKYFIGSSKSSGFSVPWTHLPSCLMVSGFNSMVAITVITEVVENFGTLSSFYKYTPGWCANWCVHYAYEYTYIWPFSWSLPAKLALLIWTL